MKQQSSQCLCAQEIKDAMPPVSEIEDSITERSTEGFPPPLNIAPPPPMIVTEKGESLNEFCNRQYPEPFTVVQVRTFDPRVVPL